MRTDVVDICIDGDSSTRPTQDRARGIVIVAAPLGRGTFDEDEMLELLAAAGVALSADPGIDRWLAPSPPATVRVHAPTEHRGVPFAFVPFVVTGLAAFAGLADGALLDEALASAGRTLDAHQLAVACHPH